MEYKVLAYPLKSTIGQRGSTSLAMSRSKIKRKRRTLKTKENLYQFIVRFKNSIKAKNISNEGYEIDILVNNAGHTLDIKDPYSKLKTDLACLT